MRALSFLFPFTETYNAHLLRSWRLIPNGFVLKSFKPRGAMWSCMPFNAPTAAERTELWKITISVPPTPNSRCDKGHCRPPRR